MDVGAGPCPTTNAPKEPMRQKDPNSLAVAWTDGTLADANYSCANVVRSDSSVVAGYCNRMCPDTRVTQMADSVSSGRRPEKSGQANKLWPMVHVLAVAALALRLLVASEHINHPDELFQYLEQAHRLVYGYGFIRRPQLASTRRVGGFA